MTPFSKRSRQKSKKHQATKFLFYINLAEVTLGAALVT